MQLKQLISPDQIPSYIYKNWATQEINFKINFGNKTSSFLEPLKRFNFFFAKSYRPVSIQINLDDLLPILTHCTTDPFMLNHFRVIITAFRI